MDLDTLLKLPGIQAAIVCFCLICLVIIICCCLYKLTSVKRTRSSYRARNTTHRKKSQVKIIPSNNNKNNNSNNNNNSLSSSSSNDNKSNKNNNNKKKPVLKKKLSFSKQLSVSDRNLQRIKHEYESNGARFDKKQDLIKNESFLKTQHKIKQRQERRKKNITKTKLLPVITTKSATKNGKIANENNIIDNKNFKSNKDENDNHRRASNVMHGITSDFRHDTSDYQHEAELIKNKQLEHTKKRLEQRRNSSTIHTTVAIDSV